MNSTGRPPIPYICPRHGGLLTGGSGELACADGCRWPVVDGVPRFDLPELAGQEVFQEEWAATNRDLGFFHALVKKEGFIRRHVRQARGPILDLGCGGGWRLFPNVDYTVGLDTENATVTSAKQVYQQVVQSDLRRLPFPDESFGTVVSIDVLGHIPPQDKNAVLLEIRRVLISGGLTVHYIECESHDPLAEIAEREEEFAAAYVDIHGHVGLEAPSDIFARFRWNGFDQVEERSVYRLLSYSKGMAEVLTSPAFRRHRVLRAMGGAFNALNTGRAAAPIRRAVDLTMAGAIAVGDRVLPRSWANGVLVAYRKPPSA